MKKLLFLIIPVLIISSYEETQAQYDYNWAVGFRIGEPLGFNLRKYFQNGDKAFDVNVGTYGFIYNKDRRYNNGKYRVAGLMIQGIYLYHTQIFNRDWAHAYYGFGGQINSRKHYPDAWINQSIKSVSKLSLGPAGTAGFELKLPKQELAFFLDGGLYVEALPAPLFLNWQVSGGLRLNLVKTP